MGQKGSQGLMMYFNKMKLITVAGALLISFASLADGSPSAVLFPKAEKNTPYAQVADLGFRPADVTIDYSPSAENNHDQFASLWLAEKRLSEESPSKKSPLLVFIHGGCWLSAFDMSHSFPMSTGLQQAGYNVLSLEYRRAGNGGEWPVALSDIRLGLQHSLRVIAGGLADINAEHIIIIGHSAGGHLAAMLSASLEDVLPSSVKRVDIITLAGIMDIEQYSKGSNSCESATPKFMGGKPGTQPQAYFLANPQSYAINPPKLARFILLQGTSDSIVSATQASHKNAETVLLEGVGHFDWIHPGSSAFKHLLSQIEKSHD
jgi:acetyl esterase/lipase